MKNMLLFVLVIQLVATCSCTPFEQYRKSVNRNIVSQKRPIVNEVITDSKWLPIYIEDEISLLETTNEAILAVGRLSVYEMPIAGDKWKTYPFSVQRSLVWNEKLNSVSLPIDRRNNVDKENSILCEPTELSINGVLLSIKANCDHFNQVWQVILNDGHATTSIIDFVGQDFDNPIGFRPFVAINEQLLMPFVLNGQLIICFLNPNGERNFKPLKTGFNSYPSSMKFIDGAIYMALQDGNILSSRDLGTTWNREWTVNLGPRNYIRDILKLGDGTVVVATNEGALQSLNSGNDWETISGVGNGRNRIAASSNASVLYNGNSLHFRMNGNAWKSLKDIPNQLITSAVLTDKYIYITSLGRIYRREIASI